MTKTMIEEELSEMDEMLGADVSLSELSTLDAGLGLERAGEKQ